MINIHHANDLKARQFRASLTEVDSRRKVIFHLGTTSSKQKKKIFATDCDEKGKVDIL